MDWATIRPALKSAVEACLGLTANNGQVEWKGHKRSGYQRPINNVRVDMSIRSIRGVGDDEELLEYDADDDVNDVVISGARRFTRTLRIESDEQSDSGIAHISADRIRTRLKRRAIAASLRAVGVAVAGAEAAQQIDYVTQDRAHSVVVLDVQMNAVENDADADSDAAEWVQTTEVVSDTLDGPGGDPLANQVEITVESA